MSLANRQVGPCVGVGGAIYLQPENWRTARSRETSQSARFPFHSWLATWADYWIAETARYRRLGDSLRGNHRAARREGSMCEGQQSLPSDESAGDRVGAVKDVGTDGVVSADRSDEPGSGRHSAPAQNLSDEEKLELISWGVNHLQDQFEDQRRYDEAKEVAFQQLYEDLSQFRALAAAAQSNPILIEIIRLQDRVEESLVDEPKHSFILSVRDELSEILARHGVVEIVPTTESPFDPRTQRALSARDTTEEDKHKSVAEIKRKGYERNGQVLRAAEVIVYRHVRA